MRRRALSADAEMLIIAPCCKDSESPSSGLFSTFSVTPMPQFFMPSAVSGAPIHYNYSLGYVLVSIAVAMHTDAVILYAPWIFALSLLSAVVLTTFALWVKFKLAETMALGETQSRVLAGSLLGLATTATHYIGMKAARIIATHATTPSQFNNHEHIHLVMQIGLTTLTLSLLVFVGNLLLRYRELNHQLIRSEARSRAIVEGAVDGIISVDDDGRIVAMNEAAERLFGWAPEQFIQRTQRFSTLVVPEDVKPFRDCLAQAVKSKKDQFIEFRLIDRFEQKRAMLQCVRYVRDPVSRHTWIDGTMMDITPVKTGVSNFTGAD